MEVLLTTQIRLCNLADTSENNAVLLSLHPVRLHKVSVFPITDDVHIHHLFKVFMLDFLSVMLHFFPLKLIRFFVKIFLETMKTSHCSSNFISYIRMDCYFLFYSMGYTVDHCTALRLGLPITHAIKTLCIISQPSKYAGSQPPVDHWTTWIWNEQVNRKKNPCISEPTQFKSALFKAQL